MATEGQSVLEPLWRGLPSPGHDALSGSATCTLSTHYEAVRVARDFTETTLSSWQLARRCDDVTLVVSELVTNALRHAMPASHGYRHFDEFENSGELDTFDDSGELGTFDAPVRLHLMRWASRLVCAVRDPSQEAPRSEGSSASSFPVLADFADDQSESGRGLFLVEAFSDSWGWEAVGGTSTGKVVWALFRLPASGRMSA